MKNIETQIREHAIESYPNECVGYISGGGYTRLVNISKRPRTRYRVSIDDKLMLFSLGDKLTALVHSHPHMDNTPSEKDIAAWNATKFNFYIIGTDGNQTTEIRRLTHA